MCRYLILLIFIGYGMGQIDSSETDEDVPNQINTEKKNIINNHNLSVGFLDDRTGLSLIGYTYNIKQTTMDEYFIGCGTMKLTFTGTVGWKHYYTKSKLSVSSVICGQYLVHPGVFIGFMSTMSYTLEYNLAKWVRIKLGGLGLITFTDGVIVDVGGLPFVGLNFSF